MKVTSLQFARANALVDEFVKLGLLVEQTGQRRNRVFAYDPYVKVVLQGERARGQLESKPA
jgi:hypothetical protein